TFVMAMVAIIGRSAFQAVGYPLPALVVIMLRLIIIAVPAAYFFAYSLGLGIYGVWFGLIAGGFISMIVSVIWLRTILNQIIDGKREFRRV
ncbi:MAG: hypothetical protein JXA95_04020, partial [Spirochaetales bacterium]|nr:hypothetical protein [Spirochaetales bacterium]